MAFVLISDFSSIHSSIALSLRYWWLGRSPLAPHALVLAPYRPLVIGAWCGERRRINPSYYSYNH